MTRRVIINQSASSGQAAGRGLGRYTSTLAAGLAERTDIEMVSVITSSGSHLLPTRFKPWSDSLALFRSVSRAGADLYHATTVYELPIRVTSPAVCSIQDIIPLDMPQYSKTGIKANYFHGLARNCRSILTQSTHTRGRVIEILNVDPRNVFLAPLPVRVPEVELNAVEAISARLPAGPFVVSLFDLRTYDPRKRFDLFLKIASGLDVDGVEFVIIGAMTDEVPLPSNVRGLGRLSDAEMVAVYQSALCYLYTSSYEGQGLPPQEAMAVGTPAVAVDNTAIGEMAGPGSLLSIESDIESELVESLTAAVRRLYNDRQLRERLSSAGKQHIASFDMPRFLKGVLDSYEHAWAEGG